MVTSNIFMNNDHIFTLNRPSEDSDLSINYMAGFLSAPLVFDGQAVESVLANLRQIDEELSVTVLTAFVNEDDESLIEHLGLNEFQVRLARRCLEIEQIHGLRDSYQNNSIVRADIMLTDSAPGLIELNYTSACGGFDEELVYGAATAGNHPPLSDRRLRHTNILDELVSRLFAVTKSSPGVVALVDEPISYRSYHTRLELLSKLLEDRDIEALHCDYTELEVGANGELLHSKTDQRVDTVWRFFMLDDIRDARSLASIEPIIDSWSRSGCYMFGSLYEEVKGSKTLLADLYDSRNTPSTSLTIPETHRLPWAFIEIDSWIRGHGFPKLPRSILEEKDDWVVKTAFGHAGEGVLLGRECLKDEWIQALYEHALQLTSRSVVQRVVGDKVVTLDENTVHEPSSFVNLGLFLNTQDIPYDRNSYGGSFLRVSHGHSNRIGLSNDAITGCVLVTD